MIVLCSRPAWQRFSFCICIAGAVFLFYIIGSCINKRQETRKRKEDKNTKQKWQMAERREEPSCPVAGRPFGRRQSQSPVYGS